ncbi:hypothetical protein ACFX2J_014327 [Malus domestica]
MAARDEATSDRTQLQYTGLSAGLFIETHEEILRGTLLLPCSADGSRVSMQHQPLINASGNNKTISLNPRSDLVGALVISG